jgi:hypothetical protein
MTQRRSRVQRQLGGQAGCGRDRSSRAGARLVAILLAIVAPACAEPEPEPARASPSTTASTVQPAGAALSSLAPPPRNSGVTGVCRAVCEHTRPLGCPLQNECLETCVGMAAGTPCTAEVVGLYECLLREPISRWECADDGTAAIRDGSCEGEQSRAAHCLDTQVKP